MQPRYTSVQPIDETGVTIEKGSQRKKRYIHKDGNCNVVFHHVPEEWLLFVTDIFTTLVEIRWRVMFLIFALSYILSWLFFGILFWTIALAHGDIRDHNNEPCVFEVRSFTAAFLFSLETQTTIGYGFRGMSENCMIAIIIVTIQDVISCFIDTFVIGIVVAKMASARKRAQTIGFSDCAVINLRDGYLCLCWRVGDFRKNHLVEGVASAQIFRSIVHATGKVDVSYEDLAIWQSNIALVTPTTIIHRIEAGSPLYKMSLEDLRKAEFELVVSFTYTDDSTGILHQTRTSYTPEEILWGHLFQEMIRVSRKQYMMDYNLFNDTAKVLAPTVSAEQFEHEKQLKIAARPSARHSPRCCQRHSPKCQPRKLLDNQLKPPSVTVELVGENPPEPNVSSQHADSLALPDEFKAAEQK